MAIIIGVDEAGYGPNYGPLAVAATAWRVEDEGLGVRGQGSGKKKTESKRARASSPPARVASTRHATIPDLYKLLRRAVVKSPVQCSRRVSMADSKALYQSGATLASLERGVLAAIACLTNAAKVSGRDLPGGEARGIDCHAALLDATAADPLLRRRELPCHVGDQLALPVDCCVKDVGRAAALLQTVGEKCGVALVAVRVRLVFPAEFNELCDRFGTKGAALSHVTLELVRRVVDEVHAHNADAAARPPLPQPPASSLQPLYICLDKHGGRNRYAALLQHHFAESWIDVLFEGRLESRYAWRHNETPVEAIFRVRGESMLPTALASMTAKYHRELSMRAFNAFWVEKIPGLRPTAGYPRDASRFRNDIAAKQRELGIDDRLLWRSR